MTHPNFAYDPEDPLWAITKGHLWAIAHGSTGPLADALDDAEQGASDALAEAFDAYHAAAAIVAAVAAAPAPQQARWDALWALGRAAEGDGVYGQVLAYLALDGLPVAYLEQRTPAPV
jgi:hypothetical protein